MDIVKAKTSIKRAYICGIISTFLTLTVALVALYHGGNSHMNGLPLSVYALVDVAILIGLTTGLFFKSRVCAVIMVAYFLVSKYIQFSSGMVIRPMTFIAGLILLYFYIQGARGTFIYHKLRRRRRSHRHDKDLPPPIPTTGLQALESRLPRANESGPPST